MTNVDSNDFFAQQYKKYTLMGFIICGVFFLAVIFSSLLINISGAITATGTVVQIGENKTVQHTKGGAIKRILVEEGDYVNQGDTVVMLDSVSIDSQLELLKQQEFELQVTLERLAATIANTPILNINEAAYPSDIRSKYPNVIATQQSIFNAQRDLHLTNLEELNVRLAGLDDEKKALAKQESTNRQQLAILDESIAELSALFERQLISKSRLTTLERDKVNVLTQLESLKVTRLQKNNAYNETLQRIEKLTSETKEKTWQEIERTKEELVKVQTSIPGIQDDFSRLDIKAPVSGRVHKLSVNNINAVIKAGDPILEIVPSSGNFIIHSQVKPSDIEQLSIGQETRIRFDSFDQQQTPELLGKIEFISADSITETGPKAEKNFLVKVSIDSEELEKANIEMNSGLPVSTMFTTTERSLMNYLIKPLSEQLFSAFREN